MKKRNATKEIILLCKGWYDEEKYPTKLEALKEYYRKYYNYGRHDMDDDLNEKFIFRVILLETMKNIVKTYPDRMHCFINGFLGYVDLFFGVDENNNDYDYQMYHRIIRFLDRLPMHGEGWIEIETSDYFEKYVDEEGNNRRRLKEDII
jgi:hypothetical protein